MRKSKRRASQAVNTVTGLPPQCPIPLPTLGLDGTLFPPALTALAGLAGTGMLDE